MINCVFFSKFKTLFILVNLKKSEAFFIIFKFEIFSTVYIWSKFSTFSNYINILAFGQVISVLAAPIVPILLIHEKEKIVSNLSKLCLLLNICGNIYFLREGTIIGALYSTSFSILIFSLMLIIYHEYILNNKILIKRNLIFALLLIVLNLLINFRWFFIGSYLF